ncbi:MAG: hypothetical protein J5966_09375, partial [Lachnospiraceae bacterium]|nr:hypothetical protein [Lachnospiraceae bacterium]
RRYYEEDSSDTDLTAEEIEDNIYRWALELISICGIDVPVEMEDVSSVNSKTAIVLFATSEGHDYELRAQADHNGITLTLTEIFDISDKKNPVLFNIRF